MGAFLAESNGNSFNLASCGSGGVAGMTFDENMRPVMEIYWYRLCSPVAPGAFL